MQGVRQFELCTGNIDISCTNLAIDVSWCKNQDVDNSYINYTVFTIDT
jgi:hypothetical protein